MSEALSAERVARAFRVPYWLRGTRMSSTVFDLFMLFCPRCGVRLATSEKPAACTCGWREEQEPDDE